MNLADPVMLLVSPSSDPPNGRARVVFVTNDAAKSVTATLLAGDASSLRDPFTKDVLRTTGGKVSLALPAHSVRMLIVE